MNLLSLSYAGRTSKSLTVQQRKAMEGIIKKYRSRIDENNASNTYESEKEDVINILIEKGYDDVANVLKDSRIQEAPLELIREIEEFQKKYAITVFALNISADNYDYILILPDNNPSNRENKRSILHQTFASAGNFHTFSNKIESHVFDTEKMEDILRWPSVRSTNLTTYRGRYRVLSNGCV